jgi:hypothetical protein
MPESAAKIDRSHQHPLNQADAESPNPLRNAKFRKLVGRIDGTEHR